MGDVMTDPMHIEAVNLQGPVLPAVLVVPEQARGLVLIADNAGTSGLGRRNRWVAAVLQHQGIATLTFHLLSEAETREKRHVVRLSLLARRLCEAIDWVDQRADLQRLPVGLFGEGMAAAPALMATALRADRVASVVLLGGRPDLAMHMLAQVRVPTLLIVGGRDTEALAPNREVFRHLAGAKRLEVVPDATQPMEEAGALEGATALAAAWFERHLSASAQT